MYIHKKNESRAAQRSKPSELRCSVEQAQVAAVERHDVCGGVRVLRAELPNRFLVRQEVSRGRFGRRS